MKHCIVCGETTKKPWEAALSHFKFYEPGMWGYLRGNMEVSGTFSGIRSTLFLAFPFFNTLYFWRYRKMTLVIPGITDENGNQLE